MGGLEKLRILSRVAWPLTRGGREIGEGWWVTGSREGILEMEKRERCRIMSEMGGTRKGSKI